MRAMTQLPFSLSLSLYRLAKSKRARGRENFYFSSPRGLIFWGKIIAELWKKEKEKRDREGEGGPEAAVGGAFLKVRD